jgi:hypothetical protein
MFEENLIKDVFAFQDDMLSTGTQGMRFVIPRRASPEHADQKKTTVIFEFTYFDRNNLVGHSIYNVQVIRPKP